MKFKKISHLILASFLLFRCTLAAHASPNGAGEADRVLTARIKQFAQSVSIGQPKEFERLVSTAFDPELKKLPLETHIGILMSMWDMSRGLDFVSLNSTRPYEGTAEFKNRLTRDRSFIYFRVESGKPHRFVTIRTQDDSHIERATNIQLVPKISGQRAASELDEFMDRLAKAEVFSGAVALIGGDKTIFQGAYGFANRDSSVANTTETKFIIGSIGKTFTAVGIAQLAEQGRLSYEDSLAKFLPQFPGAGRIKIKHLLSHSSGLSMFWAARPAPEGTRPRGIVDEMFATIPNDEPLAYEPGTQFSYSNTGYLVLGKVIEIVSGLTYADFIQHYVFDPAGMSNTSLEWDPSMASRYDKVFDQSGKATYVVRLPPPGAHPTSFGGAVSTVGDLGRFATALRAGKLLAKENVQVLISSKPELGVFRYGYGFDVDGFRMIAGHAGGAPGVSANLDMFLGSDLTAIVLSNCTETAFESSAPVVEELRQVGQRLIR